MQHSVHDPDLLPPSMTNHPKELDIHVSGGPPEGFVFSVTPDEDDLMSMVTTMQDITSFGIAGRIWERFDKSFFFLKDGTWRLQMPVALNIKYSYHF